MKVATVLAHAPTPVKDLLHAAAREVRRTYATLRQFIWENVLARGINTMGSHGPVPMEVDAIGKSKGKGRNNWGGGAWSGGKPGGWLASVEMYWPVGAWPVVGRSANFRSGHSRR